jgi:hypothetical protein
LGCNSNEEGYHPDIEELIATPNPVTAGEAVNSLALITIDSLQYWFFTQLKPEWRNWQTHRTQKR